MNANTCECKARLGAPVRAWAQPARADLSRRKFLSVLWMAPLAVAGVALLRRVRRQAVPAPLPVAPDLPVGTSFLGDAVVNRDAAGRVTGFAARCTHLGCRLERMMDGQIVCSCHGSRFHPDGRVAAGPAARPLRPLRVERDVQTGGWTVHGG